MMTVSAIAALAERRTEMNENQIHCSCGASWLIWENVDDIIDVDNGDFDIVEFRIYICPKCMQSIEASIYFSKTIKKIKY